MKFKEIWSYKTGEFRGLLIFPLLAFTLLIMSCGGSRNISDLDVDRYEELKRVVLDRQMFAIENQWANPMGGNRIDLIGNSNFIRFKGDSVKLFLPYFGVRHSGGAYDPRGGIEYEGPLNNLEITENPGKSIRMSFEGNDGSEDLRFYITLYPGGSAITNVNSSERESISYQGRMKELPEEALQ